jgi:nuclear transport factor 2 (NTF2) superfamily protein
MNEQLSEFAKRYAEAWCSRDPEAVVAFYAPNASISVNDGAPAQIAEVARSFMRDFPDMIVTFDKLEPRGDRFAFHWTLIGTYAQNGNRVRISGYELWKVDDQGLIAESKGHFDAAEYQRQLAGN